MSLDQNAGKKRVVSLSRNLAPLIEATENKETTVAEAVKIATETPSYTRTNEVAAPAAAAPVTSPMIAAKPIAFQTGRTKKISFLAEPTLEERFRKARLKAGYEKLEDAYNKAILIFCEMAEKGKIENTEW